VGVVGGGAAVNTIWSYCKDTLGLRVEFGDNLFGQDAAVFSPDGAYRYMLSRIWGTEPPTVFVMLNPSTADAAADDPTIRRCLGFARRWGSGGLVVLNLFALRATDPRVMLAHPQPVGERNDAVFEAVTSMHAYRWVAAWGVNGTHQGRDARVRELLAGEGVRLRCLNRTRDGHPQHPLYVRADATLTALEPGDCRACPDGCRECSGRQEDCECYTHANNYESAEVSR
jgi:hypothetical protein